MKIPILAALVSAVQAEEEEERMRNTVVFASGAQGEEPQFVSAEIGTVNGYTLVVTFDRDVSASNYATGVTIKVNTAATAITVATRQVNHAVVHYVIDDIFIIDTDIVTWEYTGGNIVAEVGGLALPTVISQTVTNNEEIMKQTMELTNAQILTLPTAGVNIVAAPGANKVIRPILVSLVSNFAAAAYTNMSAGSYLYLDDNSGDVTAYCPCTSFVNSTTPKIATMGAFVGVDDGVTYPGGYVNRLAISTSANSPLILYAFNSGGDFTGGNAANTLNVIVIYAILDV